VAVPFSEGCSDLYQDSVSLLHPSFRHIVKPCKKVEMDETFMFIADCSIAKKKLITIEVTGGKVILFSVVMKYI
jgi:hypothetical protein